DLARIKDGLDLFVRSDDRRVASLEKLLEPLRTVMDTLAMLGWEVPRAILQEKRAVIDGIISGKIHPTDSGLMELASALLYVESTLTTLAEQDALDDESGGEVINGLQKVRDGEDDDAAFAGRSTLSGAEYRQVVNAVIHEAKTDMAKAKESIVTFMEAPGAPEVLEGVPGLFGHVAGGLVMLGMERATEYLNAVKRYIGVNLIAQGGVPGPEELEHLADAISAIEYHLEAVEENRLGREEILDMAEKSLHALGYPWPVQSQGVVAEETDSAEPSMTIEAESPSGMADDGFDGLDVAAVESGEFEPDSPADAVQVGDAPAETFELDVVDESSEVPEVDAPLPNLDAMDAAEGDVVSGGLGIDLEWDDIGTVTTDDPVARQAPDFSSDGDEAVLSFEDQEPLIGETDDLDIEIDLPDPDAYAPGGYGTEQASTTGFEQIGESPTDTADDDLLGTVAFDVSDLGIPSPDDAKAEAPGSLDVPLEPGLETPVGLDEPSDPTGALTIDSLEEEATGREIGADDGTEVLDINDFDLGESSVTLEAPGRDEKGGVGDDELEIAGEAVTGAEETDLAASPGTAEEDAEITLSVATEDDAELNLDEAAWNASPENLHELDIGDLDFDFDASGDDTVEDVDLSGFSALEQEAEPLSQEEPEPANAADTADATVLMSMDELGALVDEVTLTNEPQATADDAADEGIDEVESIELSDDVLSLDVPILDTSSAAPDVLAADDDTEALDPLPLLDSGEPEPLPEDLISPVDALDDPMTAVGTTRADGDEAGADTENGVLELDIPDLINGAPETVPADIILEVSADDVLPVLDSGAADEIPHDIMAPESPGFLDGSSENSSQEQPGEPDHFDLDLPDLQSGEPEALPDDLIVTNTQAGQAESVEGAIGEEAETGTRMALNLGGLGRLGTGSVTLAPGE
ncbi:MAG: hypothetical protein ACPGUC_09485, partial [Gammaproteobacteria bacterium]